MGHGKETPRQKMIGMMYLVLTALLAMNVSKDVLNAFILVDEGLTKTTENFSQKNESLYRDFEKQALINPTKVADWKSKADEVKKRSQELYNLMQEYKKKIVITADGADNKAIVGEEVQLSGVQQKDNTTVPSTVMIFEKKGMELKEQFIKHREYLISLVEDTAISSGLIRTIESSLDTRDLPPDKTGEPRPWEAENFQDLPLAAVITMLSKMQSDVRNAESDIVTYLFSQVDAGDVKFNAIDAMVIANSDYIFKGQEYQASVFLAAYDSTNAPKVTLDNGTELPVSEGKGIYKTVNSIVGKRVWAGTIVLDQGGGNITRREFKKEYTVAEASAVVSPTKMNVFYRGVRNPVSISVPNTPEEGIFAEITKGLIKRSTVNWEVWPEPGPENEEVIVKVYAMVQNKKQIMGQMPFRVKDVPNPIVEIAGTGKSIGFISKNQLNKGGGLRAVMKGFDFELEFTIKEFDVSATFSGFEERQPSDGTNFSKKQKDIIEKLKNGQKVYFENVKAVGPSGDVRTLADINLKIN